MKFSAAPTLNVCLLTAKQNVCVEQGSLALHLEYQVAWMLTSALLLLAGMEHSVTMSKVVSLVNVLLVSYLHRQMKTLLIRPAARPLHHLNAMKTSRALLVNNVYRAAMDRMCALVSTVSFVTLAVEDAEMWMSVLRTRINPDVVLMLFVKIFQAVMSVIVLQATTGTRSLYARNAPVRNASVNHLTGSSTERVFLETALPHSLVHLAPIAFQLPRALAIVPVQQVLLPIMTDLAATLMNVLDLDDHVPWVQNVSINLVAMNVSVHLDTKEMLTQVLALLLWFAALAILTAVQTRNVFNPENVSVHLRSLLILRMETNVKIPVNVTNAVSMPNVHPQIHHGVFVNQAMMEIQTLDVLTLMSAKTNHAPKVQSVSTTREDISVYVRRELQEIHEDRKDAREIPRLQNVDLTRIVRIL